MRRKKNLKWNTSLVVSAVDAHPDLLSIPTFVLFVQKDELLDSHADYLGFTPESVPLFPPGQAVPPPLRPFLGSIAASMQRFTEEMELTQQSSQERETLRRRLQDGLIAKGCAQPNSRRRCHILTSASGLCGAGLSRPIRS